MTIDLKHVFKKYNKDWVFRDVGLEFKTGRSYAITGPNGSGKSTLLQIIAANILPTRGVVVYNDGSANIEAEKFFRYISVAAPYLELPEAFTLKEFLDFHFKFKTIRNGLEIRELPSMLNLDGAEHKPIKNFSTGMKQRLKLGIALAADTPVVLLDEPATNLDRSGFKWYREEIDKNKRSKLLIVASNREEEYAFCDDFIDILRYKS